MKTPDSQPIICGTDFSERAQEAAKVADALAKRLDAPLMLVHSVDERGEYPSDLRTRLKKQESTRLAEEAGRLRGLGLKFEEQVLGGLPDEGVASFGEKAGARLLVVGASGTGSLGRAVLGIGDVAEQIAETSSVPTLVVREGEKLAAWARGEGSLKIFIATDFSATSDAALRWVAGWRQIGPCEITIGYVHQKPEARGELAIYGGIEFTRLTSQERAGLEGDLGEKALRLLGVAPVIQIELGSARVDAHLILLATEAGADLLVMGMHQWPGVQRMWHPSISRRILHDAPMSVACVPGPVALEGSAAAIPSLGRVLVATDFSERADHAVPYAYSTVSSGGTVCLLHIKPDSSDLVGELEARLRALVPAAAARRGVVTELRIVEDVDAGKAIYEAAEHFSADLVCISSHGRSRLVAALVGSVAQAVIAKSPCPVLVVRRP